MLKNLLSQIERAVTVIALAIIPTIGWAGTSIGDVQVSGFAYTTMFSDNNWYNDRTTANVNLDYDVNSFALRAQASTYHKGTIRRLLAEYAFSPYENVEMVGQVGRFSRVDSFQSGVTDSPASYQMAMLQQAGYSYRMFNGAFALMDGLNFWTSYRNDVFLVKARYARGKMVVPSQDDLIMEAYKKPLRGVDAVYLDPQSGSEDYGLQLETEHSRSYASRYSYLVDSQQVGTSKTAFLASHVYHNINYTLDRIGYRYDWTENYVQTEWFHDYTYAADTVTKVMKRIDEATGKSVIVGHHWNEDWTSYVGQSYARNMTGPTHNKDTFVGTTWDKSPFTVSVEYHKGEGFAWRKYDAPYVNLATQGFPQWNSWVLTASYAF